ncbi:MAG: hypothetical protein U9Q17_01675, partial [Chloroflexota bacterium]|nr:hypothetical protein [Chloroflexota bacterium]
MAKFNRSHRITLMTILCILVGIVTFPAVGCASANRQPTILTLKAKQDLIAPLDSCLVECVA